MTSWGRLANVRLSTSKRNILGKFLQNAINIKNCSALSTFSALQLYWNRTSSWVFSRKFASYFQNPFSWEHLWRGASVINIYDISASWCLFDWTNWNWWTNQISQSIKLANKRHTRDWSGKDNNNSYFWKQKVSLKHRSKRGSEKC